MTQVEFTRDGHRTVSSAIAAELKDLGLRLGIIIEVGGGSIGADNLVIKMTVKSSDPMRQERAARAKFDMYAHYYGLEAGDYGAEFNGNDGRYKLVDFMPSRPKYSLVGVDVRTGKTMLFTKSIANQIIAGRAAKAAAAQQLAAQAASQAASEILAESAMF